MWLTEFREANGLSLEALGKAVRRAGAKLDPPVKVSDTLLERLEIEPKFRTVPKIADLIAEVCGATAEQRDALVLEHYKGTWKPKRKGTGTAGKKTGTSSVTASGCATFPRGEGLGTAEEATDRHTRAENSCRPVVAVDRAGFALFRFASVHNAAARCGVTHKAVYPRCMRRLGRDEFALLGFTFRYADEWDAMTDAQRRADVQGQGTGAGERQAAPEGTEMTGGAKEAAAPVVDRKWGKYMRPVVAADVTGREAGRWDSIKEACEATGVAQSTISKSIQGKRKGCRFVQGAGLAFVAAEAWDRMTEEERLEALGIKES